jgi:hypothetical protein
VAQRRARHPHEHAEAADDPGRGLRARACFREPARELRELREILVRLPAREQEEELALSHGTARELAESKAEVLLVEALVEVPAQPLADALDPEGEVVLVGRDLKVNEPGGAREDVRPLAHEVDAQEEAMEPGEQRVERGVSVEIEAFDLKGVRARGPLQRARGSQHLFCRQLPERRAVVPLEAERAAARTAARDGKARR